MKTKDLIEYYGNKVKAAAELGINPVTITNWEKSTKGIPRLRQLAIQALTKNKLKAD